MSIAGLESPSGVAVDSRPNLNVTDARANRVVEKLAAGEASLSGPHEALQSQSDRPPRVAGRR